MFTKQLCKQLEFVLGQDFKLWAQVSVFTLDRIISDDQFQSWFYLSHVIINSFCHEQVFVKIFVWITFFIYGRHLQWRMDQRWMWMTNNCCMSKVNPELLRKPKFHILLHLQDDMLNYGHGPPVGFCTEKYSLLTVF